MAGSATGTGNIYEFNGNYYEFVDTSAFCHAARNHAASQAYNGITGSLVRIDSAEEIGMGDQGNIDDQLIGIASDT